MLGYGKILCAIDFDEYAATTLRIAAAIAKESNGVLYILHVARIPIHDMDVPLAIPPNPLWEREALERLNELVRTSQIGGLRLEIKVVSGLPDNDIVRTARKLAVDVIVMASHGRSGLSHLILGSVAEHVIREAKCPVLIVRPPQEDAGSD
jgi:nucleotide-binding universal stress UspA family protein